MREVLTWFGYALLAMLILLVAVFAFYRLRGPTPAQRAALALMQRDYRPTQGVNAFARLWSMNYDIADDALESMLAKDVAAIRARVAAGEFVVDYQPAVPKLAETGDDVSRLCDSNASTCLAKVSSDPNSIQAALATYTTLLEREAGFERSDYDWNPVQRDFEGAAYANVSTAQRVWLSAIALRFVHGQQSDALADVCTNIGAWRRVRAGTNSLLTSMLGIGYVDGSVRLFAAMLAQAPADTTIPTACAEALRPVAAHDVDRCADLAGEFAFQTTMMTRSIAARSQPSWWDAMGAWLLMDPMQSEAWRAEAPAKHCGGAANQRMLADIPAQNTTRGSVLRRPECIASLSGCVLADNAAPAYAGYDERVLDFAAHLRLAASLSWLRNPANAASPTPIAELFPQRPAAMRSGKRASGYDAARGVIFVQNLDGHREARFELPVAAAH